MKAVFVGFGEGLCFKEPAAIVTAVSSAAMTYSCLVPGLISVWVTHKLCSRLGKQNLANGQAVFVQDQHPALPVYGNVQIAVTVHFAGIRTVKSGDSIDYIFCRVIFSFFSMTLWMRPVWLSVIHKTS